jgi:hypothetical protein
MPAVHAVCAQPSRSLRGQQAAEEGGALLLCQRARRATSALKTPPPFPQRFMHALLCARA